MINMKYMKPVIIPNDELAESVYLASGDCYIFTANIVQHPELGRDNYVIQIDGRHDADHHSTSRTVVIVFNNPVTYVSSNAVNVSGNGSNTLSLTFTDGYGGAYHNNGIDNIGLGQLVVESADGLAILKAYCSYCNESCGQH